MHEEQKITLEMLPWLANVNCAQNTENNSDKTTYCMHSINYSAPSDSWSSSTSVSGKQSCILSSWRGVL